MKTIKIPTCLVFLFLITTSCSLDDDDSGGEIIIDPPTYYSLFVWNEIEFRSGTESSVKIAQGAELFLFSNDTVIPKTGEYRYKESNYFTDIDSVGYFIQKEDLLYFISKQDSLLSESLRTLEDASGQAKVVKYQINDDILLIRDTLASPTIEIKYELERN